MTQIEALLCVDAGRTPPDTKAFFLDDGSRSYRYARAALAGLVLAAAVALACYGTGFQAVALLALVAGLLALTALPTLREDDNRDPKRQVLVITPSGVIVRDAFGLRSWSFDEVNSVDAGIHDSVPYLNLIDRTGKRHTIACALYRRGLRARQVITARLSLRRTSHSP